MKLLTLWQPWASLLAAGVKRHETRTFGTNYRGLVLVHAAKLEPVSVRSLVMREAVRLGVIEARGTSSSRSSNGSPKILWASRVLESEGGAS